VELVSGYPVSDSVLVQSLQRNKRKDHDNAPQKTEKKEDVKVIKKEKKSSPTSEEKGSSKNKKKIIHVKKHK
jgi:hypothetical protein